jgi:hypothetical protein
MTTTQANNFEQLKSGTEKWISLDGEYTDYQIVDSLQTEDGSSAFFLVQHKESMEILYTFLIGHDAQISVEYRTRGASEQMEDVKKVFKVFSNRL